MSRELKAGIILNYISMGTNLAMGLLLTPLIISRLGTTEYGIFMLTNSVIAWLGITDFGLGATVTRYVVSYRAKGRFVRQAHFLGQAVMLFSLMGLLALAAGIICYLYLHTLFPELSEDSLHLLRVLFLITLGNFVLAFPLRPLAAIPAACRRFLAPGLAGLAQALLNVVLTLLLLRMGGKATALTWLAFALNLGLMLWQTHYATHTLGARVLFRKPDWSLYRSMFSFSFWVMLNQLMDLLYWQIGTPIVARLCGPQAVVYYTLGLSFSRYFMMASTAISGVFTPEIMHRIDSHATPTEQTSLMIRAGRLQLCVVGVMLTGFCLFGQEFLRLWVGSSIGAHTTEVWWGALLVLIPLILPLSQNTGIAILQARHLHRGRALILLATALVCVIPGYLLTQQFGAPGMFCGTGLSLLLGHGLLLNLYYSHRAGLEMKRFYREVFCPALLPVFLCAAGGWAIPVFIPCTNWGMLIALCGGFSLYAAIVFFLLYLRREERSELFHLFRP